MAWPSLDGCHIYEMRSPHGEQQGMGPLTFSNYSPAMRSQLPVANLSTGLRKFHIDWHPGDAVALDALSGIPQAECDGCMTRAAARISKP